MTAANTNPQQVLQEEILSDARTQGEQAVKKARDEAAALVEGSRRAGTKELADRLAVAKAEADRRRNLILATVSVEVGRRRSAQIEKVLLAVCDEARKRLESRQGIDLREAAVTLVVEAVARMEGEQFTVQLSQADRQTLGDGWLEDVRRRAGKANLQITMAAEPAKADGSLLVSDADGRQMYDQTLTVRLARQWPALRREIAVRSSLVGGEPRKES